MGRMKELFMKIHYPEGIDVEREYLTDDYLSQERSYLEYLELQKSQEMNILTTKIEVINGEERGKITRIQVSNQEEQESNRKT